MKKLTEEKYIELKRYLSDFDEAAVAFSGGVDSTLLLAVCNDCIDDVTAVTSISSSLARKELACAEAFCKERGIEIDLIETDEMNVDGYVSNPPDRCYYCKRNLFETIKSRYDVVFEGSNADDASDYRPGARAVEEMGIISPLKEVGLTKAEIREISKELGLPTWDKPAMACLASRIPYGDEITDERLKMIDESETYLKGLGFTQVRVRTHGKLARIEVLPEEMNKLLEYGSDIYEKLLNTGYEYVTLDVKGYRMGSMNEVLDNEQR